MIIGLTGPGDTIVGNDVWIGNSVTIMPGVRVGDGAIIATGAVVVKDVEPYTIVGGNPAQLIRRRFSEADTERLLRIAWWDWPIETITAHARTIMAGSVDELEKIAAGLG